VWAFGVSHKVIRLGRRHPRSALNVSSLAVSIRRFFEPDNDDGQWGDLNQHIVFTPTTGVPQDVPIGS